MTNRPIFQRSVRLVNPVTSRLLVVDMQDRLLPHIADASRIAANCEALLKIAKLLSISSIATEQVPEKLGRTVASLLPLVAKVYPKTMFSCRECFHDILSGLSAENPKHAPESDTESIVTNKTVVLMGIEAHVCVLQTASDLLEQGCRVLVVHDAIGSQRAVDFRTSVSRMEQAGCVMTTTESIIFEWLIDSKHAEFRAASTIVKALHANE